jgi:hypothetical protein
MWTAPYVFMLIGEYVIEIVIDIEANATPTVKEHLVEIGKSNPAHLARLRSRVIS